MAARNNPFSKKTIKERAKVFNVAFLIAIVFALLFMFRGTYKGYDETRIETYQYYTFEYQNSVLVEIRVKPRVFNVLCDKNNESEHSCSITNKQHMREFKDLVNR